MCNHEHIRGRFSKWTETSREKGHIGQFASAFFFESDDPAETQKYLGMVLLVVPSTRIPGARFTALRE